MLEGNFIGLVFSGDCWKACLRYLLDLKWKALALYHVQADHVWCKLFVPTSRYILSNDFVFSWCSAVVCNQLAFK